MNQPPTPPVNDPLENAIRRVVAGLPPRPAPSTLEVRVLAAIAAREAQPSQVRGFAAWPAPARWLALPSLAGVAAAVLTAFNGDAAGLFSLIGAPSLPGAAWDALHAAVQAVAGAVAMLVRAVPASWWYAALIAFAVWYAGLVGIGLTAYRLLRARD